VINLSEKLFNQAKKVFEEFEKYHKIFDNEVGTGKAIIWIKDNNGNLLLFTNQYSESIIKDMRRYGNGCKEIGFTEE
jgi:hypothetical protein